MARIPTGNFGQSVATPQRQQRVFGEGAPALVAETAVGLAQGVERVALQRLAADTEERLAELQEQQSNDAMDASLKFETQAKARLQEIRRRIETGELAPEKATEEWKAQSDELFAGTLGRLQHSKPAAAANRRAAQILGGLGLQLDMSIYDAKRSKLGAQAAASLDEFGKQAAMPTEDIEEIFAKADTVFPTLAQRAGIPADKASRTLQDWKDRTRFDRARLDLESVRRDPAGVESFLARLQDGGDLASKLDPERRVSLMRDAQGAQWQLQQAQQHSVEKRERTAERALAATTKQIEAGLPLNARAWEELRNAVAGTGFAGEFNNLVEQEREVQQVLRLPVSKQQQYIQQRETVLSTEGGTLTQRANLDRLKATIERNQKEMEQAPLLAAQRLTGRPVEPINLADLLQPGGAHRAAQVFADRSTTLRALSNQFGAKVGRSPLLPQEKDALIGLLDQATVTEATQLFGALRSAVDDDDTYRAAMQQIAPDSPVRARAGILAAIGRQLVVDSSVFGNDTRESSAKVARTMLQGEAIVNRSKSQRQEDGKAFSLFAPSRSAFAATFAAEVGDLYRGRPGAQEGDLEAAYAWYVGRAAEVGRLATKPDDIDAKLARQAVSVTLGPVVNFNGQGEVLAPMGMSADEFKTKVRERFSQEVKSRGLPPSVLSMYDHYGLTGYRRDGQYVLTLGGLPVVDPRRGTPVVIDLEPQPLSGSRYRSNVDLIPKGQ